MEKNIFVLDENGNQIGLTYPKRARGLVKSGRAELVGDGAVRLKAAPSAYTERTENMTPETNEITEFKKKIDEAVKKAAEVKPDGDIPAEEAPIDLDEITRQVAELMAGQANTLNKLMEVLEKADFDYKVDAVKAITDMLRETTNNALEVYRAEAMGLADLSAAIKNVSADLGNAQFAAGMTANYREIVGN